MLAGKGLPTQSTPSVRNMHGRNIIQLYAKASFENCARRNIPHLADVSLSGLLNSRSCFRSAVLVFPRVFTHQQQRCPGGHSGKSAIAIAVYGLLFGILAEMRNDGLVGLAGRLLLK
jgi:hypothetical protein